MSVRGEAPTESATDKASLPILARLGRRLAPLYPFVSGRGSMANSRASELVLPRARSVHAGRMLGRRIFASDDDLVGRTVLLFGRFDQKAAWVMERCLAPGDTALDVGANIGTFTLPMAQHVVPGGHVHAFEPSPVALSLLERTLAENGDLPVTLHRFACGEVEGSVKMFVPNRNIGGGTIVEQQHPDTEQTFDVELRSLGDWAAQEGIERIDFMKVDVEGFEHAVFRGLFSHPETPRPTTILFEDHRLAESGNMPLLEHERYALYGFPGRTYFRMALLEKGSEGFLSSHNYLAVHERAAPELRERLRIPRPG